MDVFELWRWRRLLKSPLDCKEIQPVHPKGDQSWVFIGRTDAEAETAILWSPDATSWLIWKDPNAGKDWGQEEKGMTEDEMDGWHHPHNGHGFGWIPEVSDGQGGLACCDSWGRKESDATKWLNWTELKQRSPAFNLKLRKRNFNEEKSCRYSCHRFKGHVFLLCFSINCKNIQCLLTSLVTHKTYDYLKKIFQ